ncbi:hypothetical protein TWF970_005878 [Orbilia oligospora]|uniref:Uncharacterized protein n=1 Tax=Orbilia oligospora TaxID=2813651 RepID=A0A7C8R8Z5_ORBOL|nr:hypothetical protein TWF970_005878 [Orbilia oligospora]
MDGEGWVGLEVRYKYKITGAVDNDVYTDFYFGEDRQRIELAVTFQQVTWVPQLPDSRNRTAACDNGIILPQMSLEMINSASDTIQTLLHKAIGPLPPSQLLQLRYSIHLASPPLFETSLQPSV